MKTILEILHLHFHNAYAMLSNEWSAIFVCYIVPEIWTGCPTDNSMANCGCPSAYLVGSDNREPLISNTASTGPAYTGSTCTAYFAGSRQCGLGIGCTLPGADVAKS